MQIIDYLANVDPDDVHFRIVRMPAPDPLALDATPISFRFQDSVVEGHGAVRADFASIGVTMTPNDPEDFFHHSFDQQAPGKLRSEHTLGTLSGAIGYGTWTASGAVIVRRDSGQMQWDFHVDDITVVYADAQPALTREILYGRRIKYLSLATPTSSTSYSRDRIEEVAFGRRVTLRSLRIDADDVPLAVVYDGPPVDRLGHQTLWLAASVLAGADLASSVEETYDASGTLVQRRFRRSFPAGLSRQQPFHLQVAPYAAGTFGLLCDRINALLARDFPIDVVISHFHDMNDGSMERQMQSGLLAIHTASEAWNRLYGKATVIKLTDWDEVKFDAADAAEAVVSSAGETLAASVRNGVLNANNTSTNARLRGFFEAMSITVAGRDKRAVDLRNRLFHDGYLQRRFSQLVPEAQQDRYDDLQRIRELVLRIIFALCEIDVSLSSVVNLMQAVRVRDPETPNILAAAVHGAHRQGLP